MPIFLLEFLVIVLLLWFLWKNFMDSRKDAPIDEEKEAVEAAKVLEERKRVLAAERSKAKTNAELTKIEKQLHELEKGE